MSKVKGLPDMRTALHRLPAHDEDAAQAVQRYTRFLGVLTTTRSEMTVESL
jgi:hypothetical protein